MYGWIKLHRKIINSPMYKSLNSKQRDVLIQCMLLANHEENKWEWQGELFKCVAGQFITSLQSISDQCASDVKVQSIRTALLKLEKWGFLTNESTKTGRLISITKWHTYQSEEIETNKDSNKQLTKHQQSSNKELTTNKNDKNVKNDKKKEYTLYGEFKNVRLSDEECIKLRKKYDGSFDGVVETMSQHIASKKKDPYTGKTHYPAILKNDHWLLEKAKKQSSKFDNLKGKDYHKGAF